MTGAYLLWSEDVISPSLLEGRGAYVLYDLSLPAWKDLGEFSKVPELTSSKYPSPQISEWKVSFLFKVGPNNHELSKTNQSPYFAT